MDRVQRAPDGAGDLRLAGARQVIDRHLTNGRLGERGLDDHLQRIAEAAVRELQVEQQVATYRTHRTEIAQLRCAGTEPARQPSHEYAIGEPGVQRPRTGGRGPAA